MTQYHTNDIPEQVTILFLFYFILIFFPTRTGIFFALFGIGEENVTNC